MNKRSILLLPLCAVLCLLAEGRVIGARLSDAASESRAAEFELKDQYEKPLAYRFPKGKVSVLTFGDRKGAEQIEGWVRPLYDRYQARIDQHGVAVLSSVPSLMRGIVRGIFRSKVKYSVLLDWKGDVARSYGYQSGKANVVVIDRNGQIVLRVYGAANHQELNRVFTQIDKLL
ncbi:MAG: hypothetical protein SF339_19295 [Blastocatellia bacterium]|nr:hypothetical protein [Blastocatellia bacterium]